MSQIDKIRQLQAGTAFTAFVGKLATTERETRIYGYYLSDKAAQEDIRGKGWYGQNGWVEPVQLVKVSNHEFVEFQHIISIKEIKDEIAKNADERKKVILSKLTPEEIEFLKLK